MRRSRHLIPLLAALVAGYVAARAAAQEINTIVGTGIPGYTGDNGPAVGATMRDPQGIGCDGDGNLYIADSLNFVIRKVDAKTGTITTIAGTGVSGFSGDGGAATSAQMTAPIGIAVTVEGHLYFADISNHRIRVISGLSGVISTVAGNGLIGFAGDGGQATIARLNTPQGVTFDVFGNLCIADTANCRIRRVDGATGIITTICGTGIPTSTGDGGPATSATLSSPRRITVDPNTNDIYILDRAPNARIRCINYNSGIITTVAGGGTTVADSGVATDLNLGAISDVALDDDGNLIITSAFRVWKVEDGMATVIAGTGLGGYGGDGGDPLAAQFNNISGVALTSTGQVVLSDRSNQRIRKIGPAIKCGPADITCDGSVGVPDLLMVINHWGACVNCPPACTADIAPQPDGDCTVGVPDLLMVINNWG